MMMVQKDNLRYYFKDESVTMVVPGKVHGDQYVSFNCFSLQSRKKFHKFSKTIAESSRAEYDSIDEVYGLARHFDIRASHGHKPTVVGNIAF